MLQVWFLLRSLSLACRLLPSCFPYMVIPYCVCCCVLISSSYKATSHIEFYLNHLFQGPITKHILRYIYEFSALLLSNL